MQTINPSIRSAESISTSGRVGLDSQIKPVHPHEVFKMTETKLGPSLSMFALLPLLLSCPPSPKGTLSSDGLARLAKLGPELLPDSDTSTSLHTHLITFTYTFTFTFTITVGEDIIDKVTIIIIVCVNCLCIANRLLCQIGPRYQGHSGTNKAVRARIQPLRPPAASPPLKLDKGKPINRLFDTTLATRQQQQQQQQLPFSFHPSPPPLSPPLAFSNFRSRQFLPKSLDWISFRYYHYYYHHYYYYHHLLLLQSFIIIVYSSSSVLGLLY